ncbi:MAG TPA: hypothetical protein PLS50_09450 [Candidatus Dojkabacteria bacterium]|nr:hypothetical protein [Candidatus Dojkabacteria bacterium]
MSETWQDLVRKMVNEYNEKRQIFNDSKDKDKKIKYVIEDTHKIRFFEFADDIIEKDVFDEEQNLEVLKPKRRGRPRKIQIEIVEEPKRKKSKQ